MIPIKNKLQIAGIEAAARVASTVLTGVCAEVRPGVSTAHLDRVAALMLSELGARSACLGYRLESVPLAYPASICVSVNHEVVHGIPSADVELKEGDCVSIDVAVEYRGYIADNAITVSVGKATPEVARLLQSTRAALDAGIAQAKEGRRVGDISFAIEKVLTQAHLGIVKDFVGHGVGIAMHEEPQIPNYGAQGTGPVLREGMVLAIEPMATLGRATVKILNDGWTVVTTDGSIAAHFEKTVLVEKNKPKVLTNF